MTLSTPILQAITTFDPKFDFQIGFTYTDSQIKSKRLVITDSITSEIIYDTTQLGMRLSYDLPANSLSTSVSTQYIAQLQVFDFNGNSSELSSPVLFYCLTTPTMTFVNFDPIIHSGNVTLKIAYEQPENDALKEYVFALYSYDKIRISLSEIFYTIDDMSYSFYGLKNNQTYYVRCYGTTLHGMAADTGYVRLDVSYIMQPNNVVLNAQNYKDEGYITINCNIIDIGYKIENDNYEFVDGELILSDNKLTYNSGFTFSDDFSIFIKARKLPLNEFFSMSSDEGDISLSIVQTGGDYYCKLTAVSAIDYYYRYAVLPRANIIDTSGNLIFDIDYNSITTVNMDYEDDYIAVFELKRKNMLYSLKVYYEQNGVIET
ncbi:hypothetical protein LJC58_03900 [Lachnospiraceae bacterium OttesenSCG-928-D06]|nr:hypothetical protein [Lachnospiraceae bacterium OttesenSCG-928-D06]